MNIIIVADSSAEQFGRQLAHGISMQKGHSSSFWTVAHYKDKEATLDGKQAVVFLGSNSIADSYTNVLPERFRGYGTRCHYEGSKVVLVTDVPAEVSSEDIAEIRMAVENTLHEVHRRNASIRGGLLGSIIPGAAMGLATGCVVWPTPSPLTLLWAAFMCWISARERKRVYSSIQLEYVASRFLLDEFAPFAEGLEAIR